MKTIYLIISLLCASIVSHAQTIKKDTNGNYYQVTAKTTSTPDKKTGSTFTAANGLTYDIYVSKNGKYYILRTSKSGNVYKQYIKI